jgi:hypothetical protein
MTHLVAQSLMTVSPAIGQPALGQLHNISACLAIGRLPPSGRTPEETGFIKLLIEIISASLDRRTRSKQELVGIGKTRFRLSMKRASALRERVIDWLGATAWSDPGRIPRD